MQRNWHASPLMGLCVVALAGCPQNKPPEQPPPTQQQEGCLSNDKFFAQKIWAPILSQNCMQCHNAQGAAKDTDLVLVSSSQTGYLQINYETLKNVAALEIDGVSLVLLKPTAEVSHGGGQRMEKDSAEYNALKEQVERFKVPVECADDGNAGYFHGVTMLDDAATLRKAALAVAGRLPTPSEEALIADGAAEGLSQALDSLMNEPVFLERVKETYNDLLLTNRYLGGENAINLLNPEDYPTRQWYDAIPEDTERERHDAAMRAANDAVASEPLQLIAHVVRENKPFTEILTADYIMVNPYSAQVYGVTDVTFPNMEDATDWKEGHVPGIPHAGVLSSHMFLNRFPTTATNRNRHRSRMVYKFFLATDIMKLAERPVDPTSIQDFNPTMFNPNCTVCHANLDPVAGAFRDWTGQGRHVLHDPADYEDMRPPGFGDETLPFNETGVSLQWLARRVVADSRFATSVVHTMYTGLTGQQPLSPPADTAAADYAQKLVAQEAQAAALQAIAEKFVSEGYNLKTVVKEIVLSPYFRANNATTELSAERKLELADVGTAQLLTPEQLNRKIAAIFGRPWQGRYDQRPVLLDANQYLIFYGGIDSNSVTQRITEPNGIMANIAQRMANEVSCMNVAYDFLRRTEERKLFPHVEMTYEPLDYNGFEIPGAVAKIKENIRHLHKVILGETLYSGDPELDRTYGLFLETWKEGSQGIDVEDPLYSQYLPYACRADRDLVTGEDLPEEERIVLDRQYTIRAWMAVVTYLLSDFNFLYQ
ncbi:MAG: DUF1592 domain-containing protein [Myxococcota bacterium]